MPCLEYLTVEQRKTVEEFHLLFYNRSTAWLGYPIIKNPMDLLIYQELIVGTQPETIIECGSGGGGSALFFASLLALVGNQGQVISIDTNADVEQFNRWAFPWLPEHHTWPRQRPEAPNLTFLTMNTIAPSTVRQVKERQRGRTMVILDSDHATQHVLDECELYGPLVSEGCYLVVEDINVCGHPVPSPSWTNGGPYDAVELFLQEHAEFTWDPRWVGQYLLSYNAYLRRKTADEEREPS